MHWGFHLGAAIYSFHGFPSVVFLKTMKRRRFPNYELISIITISRAWRLRPKISCLPAMYRKLY